MIELVILGIVFSVLLLYGVPVSFCIGIATLKALFKVMPEMSSSFVI